MKKINLKNLFKDDEYVKKSNIKFFELDGDNLVLKMKPEKNQFNAYNILHGAEIFALMDTAAGCLSIINGKKAVTLDSSVNFISSISYGEEIYSNTKIIHVGKSTEVIEVVAMCKNKIIAKGSFTLFILDKVEITGREFLEN
ncbi:PaaI family thioesterase [Peptoniphilus porci]|uniref:Thioesterase n=1 Tax=Peptoniphilus porci TaxID=2652280 RepID=A0A1U7LZW3_9FIRM|nr:PaaI family thioesterase [Peptoniphilus porci]OLR64836.1 thioesterase [Peptoniphilus porci]